MAEGLGGVDPFVLKLDEVRERHGLSHQQFAVQVLAVSPQEWWYLRRGERSLGNVGIVRSALRAYPWLWPDALSFLGVPAHEYTPAARRLTKALSWIRKRPDR